jgi:hypothetical protein
MGTLNLTKLKSAGVRFPSPAAVSTFVDEIVRGLTGNQQQQAVQTPSSDIRMFGSKLRIRATGDGAVIEVLGQDGIWHLQQTFTNKKM